MAKETRFKVGYRIAQRYLIKQALLGGMGEVYLCIDLQSLQPVALKTFQEQYLTNQELRLAFNREIALWISFGKHPHIVTCYSMSTIENHPFMLLEWVIGREDYGAELRSWLRSGPLDFQSALQCAIDVCRGLIHANNVQPGIVHRDIKPDNILVSRDNIFKVTDWGISRIVQYLPQDPEDPTKSGANGTPLYMAPEQWARQELDGRTDIYALGCMLYEMLVGTPPYEGKTLPELRRQHLEFPVPSVSNKRNLPKQIDNIVERCMAKHREKRFESPKILLEELNNLYIYVFDHEPRVLLVNTSATLQDYINRGLTYLQLRYYNEALANFTRVIEIAPNEIIGYTHRVDALIHMRRIQEAIEDCNKILILAPLRVDGYLSRGNAYFASHDYQAAIADFSHAIELDSLSMTAYMARGAAYEKCGMLQEALADSNRVVELAPTRVEAYSNRGFHYGLLGQHEKALADLGHAIELNPNTAIPYCNRAGVYINLHQFDLAMVDLEHAIQLDPDEETAYLNRGLVLAHKRQFERAIPDFTRVIQIVPQYADAYDSRGTCFANLRRYEEAVSDYGAAIRIASHRADYYRHRANAYHQLGRFEDAIADFSRAIELAPLIALNYSERARVYVRAEQFQRAIDDLDKAIEIDASYVFAYQLRALAHQKLNLNNEAIDDLHKAAELTPNDPQAYSALGEIYYNSNFFNESMIYHSHSIELDPDNALYYTNRGEVYVRLGRDEEAERDFLKALELNNQLTRALVDLGVLLRNQDKLDEAMRCFQEAARLGDQEGLENIAKIKQSYKRVNEKDRVAGMAAIYTAVSIDEARQAIEKFPFLLETPFFEVLTEDLGQADQQFYLQLTWLAQIAHERRKMVSQPNPAKVNVVEVWAIEALKLAREACSLAEAIELLEKAIERQPELGEKYEYHLKLWKRGITM